MIKLGLAFMILLVFLLALNVTHMVWNYYISHCWDCVHWCTDEYWEMVDQNGSHHCMELPTLGGF